VSAVAGTSTKVRRRDVLASLAAGVAGAMSAPELAARQHELQATQPAPPAAAAADRTFPRLLDDHRRAMLAGLADLILPGARAAGVADLLDRVLAVEPPQAQRPFLNALGAFDREARARHARAWTEISAAQQIEILRAASTLAPSRPATPAWTRGQPIERASPPAPPANLRDQFDHLKDWIQRAYHTTAAGMKELGFTGQVAFRDYPGCTHPGSEHR
jgi:hypothetical protein